MTRFEWVCWVVKQMPENKSIIHRLPNEYSDKHFMHATATDYTKKHEYTANSMIINTSDLMSYRILAGALNLDLGFEAALLLKRKFLFSCWVRRNPDPFRKQKDAAREYYKFAGLEECCSSFQTLYYDFLILDIDKRCKMIERGFFSETNDNKDR